MHDKESIAYANANIALVKYWGKSNQQLNIPAVPSLSMTLCDIGTTVHVADAKTTAVFIENKLAEPDVQDRVSAFLDAWRLRHPFTGHLRISSTSSVPYAAGVASSASFYAALTTALDHHFSLHLAKTAQSILARLGSASAARSIFSGFSGLYGGDDCTHEDAFAFALHSPLSHELTMIIAMVDAQPKKISSRKAMIITERSSPFFASFVSSQAKDFMGAKAALKNGSLAELGAIMEHSTLKMFATMWSAQPAINYWQPNSLQLIELVREIRKNHGPIAFFTMDAGPQVKILTTKRHSDLVLTVIKESGLAQHLMCSAPGPGAGVVDTSHDN